MRRAAVLTALLFAGCGGPPADTLAPAPEAEGLYDFRASVATFQGQVLLEGSFEIVGDTVVVAMQQGDCIPRPGSVARLSYVCGMVGMRYVSGLRFTFERHRPLRRPTLSFEVSVPFEERVCERYQTTSEGRVCISWSVRTTYKRQRYSVQPTVVPRTTA